jgi:hypothetical protein
VNKAQKIREYKTANPLATPQAIANALGFKLQYVYTVLHKQKNKTVRHMKKVFKHVAPQAPQVEGATQTERQMAKGQMILRDEIQNLHKQITRLKLHNDMLQAMLKVQDFDLIHGHGTTV